MAALLLLTDAQPEAIFPALRVSGIDHKVAGIGLPIVRIEEMAPRAVVVDAVTDADAGFGLLLDLRKRAPQLRLLAVVAPDALERHPWPEIVDEVLAPDAPAAEVRLRLDLLARRAGASDEGQVRLGTLVMDAHAFRATVGGRPLDLTFKEFELLRFLASQPGRAFTRGELLREVWGYDFYGGTRTVDVHVRRLRAKLGPTDEHLIETVRGVGYRAATWLP